MKDLEYEFTKMVREYRKTIYSVCYFFSDNPTEVDDLFQEVLVNLWKGFPEFRGESSLKTWIWRISLNTCCSLQRKNNRNVPTIPLAIDKDLFSESDEVGRQVKMLYDRINKLEVFDRAIILLWLESMSYDEIAAIVGITTASVTSRLFRIKEQLKSMSNN
jgi:RNA polymerase sigma factor (sigma-70 family)